MKHRDHYSHSVYVFLLGLAIYKNDGAVRQAYNQKYGLKEGKDACAHFLKYWGMLVLFHDIGYPFEIAHQQMKVYALSLMGMSGEDMNRVSGYAPFVSYKGMDEFVRVEGVQKDLNLIYAEAITERIGAAYGKDTEYLYGVLSDRAVNEYLTDRNGKSKYLYMDHAYFSGLILLKKYLESHEGEQTAPDELMDAFVAVILHNSLFKFDIRGHQRGLRLSDNQPLAYLLMLCDELQCWDRTAYGQNSRNDVYPFDFDLYISDNQMKWIYYFDKSYAEEAAASKVYRNMTWGYINKEKKRVEGYKFADDIQEIIQLENKISIDTFMVTKNKRTGRYLSDTSYLNLYDFALALHGRYEQFADMESLTDEDIQKRLRESFAKLPLELKLSNIRQAKGFAKHLEAIGCFYTDRAVDYERLTEFTQEELRILAKLEHESWSNEKLDMGWRYGTDYLKSDHVKRERARTRLHKDLVDFNALGDEDIRKDSEPMRLMIRLLKVFDGLRIYRLKDE